MSGKTAAVAALAALLCAAWMGQAMATPDDNSGTGSDDSPTSFDPIDDIPGDITTAGRIIFAAVFCIGVLFLFFGYRVFKVTLFIIGFLVGAGITWLGFSIMNPEVYDHVGTDEAESIMTGVIASILVGIASGACAIALYLLGIFLIGFAFGLFVGLITTAFIFQHTQGYIEHATANTAVLIVVICGIVGGLLALKVQKAIIILSTSFAGSSQVVLSSICFVVGQTFTVNGPMPVAPYEAANLTPISYNIIVVGLALIGVVVQFKVTGKGDHHSRKPRSEVLMVDMGSAPGPQTTVVNTVVQAPPAAQYAPPPHRYGGDDPYGRAETGYAYSQGGGNYQRMT